MNDQEVKMTTTINVHLRDKIKRTLYYGQLTNFLRVALECLVEEINNNNMVGVTKFIHRESPLTLTPNKEIENDSNGQNKS